MHCSSLQYCNIDFSGLQQPTSIKISILKSTWVIATWTSTLFARTLQNFNRKNKKATNMLILTLQYTQECKRISLNLLIFLYVSMNASTIGMNNRVRSGGVGFYFSGESLHVYVSWVLTITSVHRKCWLQLIATQPNWCDPKRDFCYNLESTLQKTIWRSKKAWNRWCVPLRLKSLFLH